MNERTFGVKELSELAGVSVRTLHYYDEIGLLHPASRTASGYRQYGRAELLRLQQILLYRGMDFRLKEIISLMNDPEHDLLEAMEKHKMFIEEEIDRLSKLLNTIDFTINHFINETMMHNPEKLYEGLPREFGTTYRKEAMEKYGSKAVVKSEKELMKLSKKDYKRLQAKLEQVSGKLYSLRDQDPQCAEVQTLIAEHYGIIRQFWGTYQEKDKQADAYAGLGDLYVEDERYTLMGNQPQPEYADFLCTGMHHFAEMSLKA